MTKLLEQDLILFGPDETTQPTRKYLLRDNMNENVPSLYYFGGSDSNLQSNLDTHSLTQSPLDWENMLFQLQCRRLIRWR